MLGKRSRRHSFIVYEEEKGKWVNEHNIIPEQCEDFANETASLDFQQSKQEGAENQTMIGDHTQKKKQTGQDERVPTQKSIQSSVLHFFKQNDEQTFEILYHNLLVFSEWCKRRAIINLMRFLRVCNVAKTIEYSQHEKMASHILDVITAKKFDKLSIEPKVFKKSKLEVDAKGRKRLRILTIKCKMKSERRSSKIRSPTRLPLQTASALDLNVSMKFCL
ncbi:hypothetical protein FGO68_gene8395 [Halteria grandinella]|uniref:Uncharacterized protein n=1 Tax=Halteria grandinella TaxID=5974 RepID=A0A8J8NYT7_HALGN|nr:hypothetical protein FGO68_gene8395 [Halteria grandinella]